MLIPISSVPMTSTWPGPLRSTKIPTFGEMRAPNTPPRETAPEKAVLDQSNSVDMGMANRDRVATADPCLAKLADIAHAMITQP